MKNQIGEMAGRIWHILDSRGELTMAQLKKQLSAPDDLIQQGIGWLAREDKISLNKKGRSVTIALKS